MDYMNFKILPTSLVLPHIPGSQEVWKHGRQHCLAEQLKREHNFYMPLWTPTNTAFHSVPPPQLDEAENQKHRSKKTWGWTMNKLLIEI